MSRLVLMRKVFRALDARNSIVFEFVRTGERRRIWFTPDSSVDREARRGQVRVVADGPNNSFSLPLGNAYTFSAFPLVVLSCYSDLVRPTQVRVVFESDPAEVRITRAELLFPPDDPPNAGAKAA